MKVSDALLARKSVRAYTDKTVSKEDIKYILRVARCAPSGVIPIIKSFHNFAQALEQRLCTRSSSATKLCQASVATVKISS